jgi:hypothetical protein
MCVRIGLSTTPSLPVAWPKPCSGDYSIEHHTLFANIVGSEISPLLSNIMLHELDRQWCDAQGRFATSR